MANLNIIRNQVYNWINESDTDFNLELGENKLYLVVKWTDGASLFMEDYFDFNIKGRMAFMNELIMTYCDLDEDTDEVKVIWFNKLFGIGSEYHGIADDALEHKEGFTPIGVYDVEGVGLCTGVSFAERQTASFTGKPPVFYEWTYICDTCTYEEDECKCDDACDTESADLNKMEKERDI